MQDGIADFILHPRFRPADGRERRAGRREEVGRASSPSPSGEGRAALVLGQAFAQHPLRQLGELLRRG